MSKWFKPRKKVAGASEPVPRDLKTIDEDYARICGQLGQAKYNYMALEGSINQMVKEIHALKLESMAAQKLKAPADAIVAAAEAEKAQKAQVPNESAG